MGLRDTVGSIWRHPLNEGNKPKGLIRFAQWQVGSRLLNAPVVVPFVNNTKLIVSRGMHGATGNYYTGLMDYEDMSFVLHALRPGDLFVDIGANVGSYSICAASVGADVVAIEPIPRLVDALSANVAANSYGDRIHVLAAGLAAEPGTLEFTVDADTTNHVVAAGEKSTDRMSLPVMTLDAAVDGRVPFVIKLDVVGFEADVLAGSEATLQNPELGAVIVELGGFGAAYGHDDAEVHAALTAHGLKPQAYDPVARRLIPLSGPDERGNTIYVRAGSGIAGRLEGAPAYVVHGVER